MSSIRVPLFFAVKERVCSHKAKGPFTWLSVDRNGGSTSVISVWQETGMPSKGLTVYRMSMALYISRASKAVLILNFMAGGVIFARFFADEKKSQSSLMSTRNHWTLL